MYRSTDLVWRIRQSTILLWTMILVVLAAAPSTSRAAAVRESRNSSPAADRHALSIGRVIGRSRHLNNVTVTLLNSVGSPLSRRRFEITADVAGQELDF